MPQRFVLFFPEKIRTHNDFALSAVDITLSCNCIHDCFFIGMLEGEEGAAERWANHSTDSDLPQTRPKPQNGKDACGAPLSPPPSGPRPNGAFPQWMAVYNLPVPRIHSAPSLMVV